MSVQDFSNLLKRRKFHRVKILNYWRVSYRNSFPRTNEFDTYMAKWLKKQVPCLIRYQGTHQIVHGKTLLVDNVGILFDYTGNGRNFHRHVVYLDSPSGLTTKMLTSTRLFDKTQLHIPNMDPGFLTFASSIVKSTATVYYRSLYEWMRDLPRDHSVQYDIGADYTCTFAGNPSIRPKVDLQIMFERQLLARHNGVLWLTLSYRQRHATLAGLQKEIMGWIELLAQTFGYKVVCNEKGSYFGVMYFLFVTV